MLIERKKHYEEDGSIGYIESIFNSGNVLKTTYFPQCNVLYIAFNRGDTYSYQNVTPELYDKFEAADSQGSFFYKNFNKNKSYPSRREFTLYPNEVNDLKEVVENNMPDENDKDE